MKTVTRYSDYNDTKSTKNTIHVPNLRLGRKMILFAANALSSDLKEFIENVNIAISKYFFQEDIEKLYELSDKYLDPVEFRNYADAYLLNPVKTHLSKGACVTLNIDVDVEYLQKPSKDTIGALVITGFALRVNDDDDVNQEVSTSLSILESKLWFSFDYFIGFYLLSHFVPLAIKENE